MGDLFLFSNYINGSHTFAFYAQVFVVFAVILGISACAVSKMKMVPSGAQNIMEGFIEAVVGMGMDMMGDEKLAKKYMPMVATIGLCVFVSNMVGIIPGFEAPTASLNFTVPLALTVALFYHIEGIKTQGVLKYFSHFFGPVKAIAPLVFLIEIVSHVSRVASLSFRLFGNIKGDDLFLMVLLALAPYVAPVSGFALLTLMGSLQAYVYMMLAYVYIAGAVIADEEH